MKIRIDPHTVDRMSERGISETEITEVIEKGVEFSAKYAGVILTVTAYAYYGKWEKSDADNL